MTFYIRNLFPVYSGPRQIVFAVSETTNLDLWNNLRKKPLKIVVKSLEKRT